MFKKEMVNTVWTVKGYEKCIEEYAYNHYLKRKEDFENKADALMSGILYANSFIKRIKVEIN